MTTIRTAQADNELQVAFEELLKHQPAPQLGLLIGKHAAAGKALLYGTVKTPSLDGLEPLQVAGGITSGGSSSSSTTSKAGKKGTGGRAGAAAAAGGGGALAVTLEAEWITEHARQVARMLPGGLYVLGLYVFCPDAAATAAQPQLCAILAALGAFCLPQSAAGPGALNAFAAAPAASAAAADAAAGASDLLLLTIDSGSRKQALRAFPAAPSAAPQPQGPSSLRPCELRFAPTLGNMLCVRCWHGVDVSLPVPAAKGGAGGQAAELRRQLAAAVEAEGERIRHGVFALAGALLPDATPVGEALAASPPPAATSPSSAAIPTHDLTLLAPPLCQQLPAGPAEGAGFAQQPQQPVAAVGRVVLRGAVLGLAYVGKREAAARAAAELKADLVASLSARAELLAEEALRAAADTPGGGGGGQGAGAGEGASHPLLLPPSQLPGGCSLELPRRVLLPWLGGMRVCDYLLPGEGRDAAAERVRELLALEVEARQVDEPERPAAPLPAEPWRPNAVPAAAVEARAGSGGAGAKGGSGGVACGVTAAASVAVAAVAAAVGVALQMGALSLGGARGQ